MGDLDGDILTIARATSNEVVGPTKSGRIRRLTLVPTTAALWRHTVTQWRHAPVKTSDSDRGCSPAAPTTPPACLRPASRTGSPNCAPTPATRTSPSTASGTPWPQPWYPKETSCRPKYRLGHRDAATTLRIYSHVLPLTDHDAAATIEELYRL